MGTTAFKMICGAALSRSFFPALSKAVIILFAIGAAGIPDAATADFSWELLRSKRKPERRVGNLFDPIPSREDAPPETISVEVVRARLNEARSILETLYRRVQEDSALTAKDATGLLLTAYSKVADLDIERLAQNGLDSELVELFFSVKYTLEDLLADAGLLAGTSVMDSISAHIPATEDLQKALDTLELFAAKLEPNNRRRSSYFSR